MKFALWKRAGAAAVLASACLASNAQADSSKMPVWKVLERLTATQFALVGDVPYRDGDIAKFDEVIREINASRMEFTVHTGDIKTGSSLCSDELLKARFDQLQQLKRPLVYTPGDNEWTDCHRPAAGSYEPLERLAKLRSLFFPRPHLTTGKTPMRVRSQAEHPGHAEFVENVMFERNAVVFATVHVVGSSNGYALWNGVGETAEAPRQDRIDEVERRIRAAVAWIDEAFDAAEQRGAAGVFIAMQANPAIESQPGSGARRGFDEIVAKISERTIGFGRPVLVAHGDSHYYRYDKPLVAPTEADGQRRVEDFSRVENFGDADVHWVEVIADPRTPEVFRIVPHIVESNRFAR
jgi:hypothetical protein